MIVQLNKKICRVYNIYMRSYCCKLKMNKQKKDKLTPITNQQWKEIRDFWNPYLKKCKKLPLVLWGGGKTLVLGV